MNDRVVLNAKGATRAAAAIAWVEKQRIDRDGEATESQDPDRRYFWGVTVATDGTEYTDERYTVVSAYPSNNGDGDTAVVTFTAFATDHPSYVKVTARNLLERGTHIVPVGTPVVIFWDYDSTTTPRPVARYWFDGDPIGNPEFQGMALIGATQNQRAWGFQPATPMET